MKTGNTKTLVDHKDGDGLNNQEFNLRKANHCQNAWNRKAIRSASKYKGVSLMTSRYKNNVYQYWLVRITVNGRRITLGSHPNTKQGERKCARLYNIGAKKHHGEFAKLNKL